MADRDDEGRHRPGPGRLWEESYAFDFAAGDGSLGGYVRLGLRPADGVAWYWAAVVGPDRPLVLVRDHDVPLPGGSAALPAPPGGDTTPLPTVTPRIGLQTTPAVWLETKAVLRRVLDGLTKRHAIVEGSHPHCLGG